MVAFGAFLHVLLPYDGDQSIFALAGEVIASGGQPYVDYWDVKQPGILYFFAIAGSLFGFSSVGIHLFELLWWVAVLIPVWLLIRPMLANAWLAAAVPLVFLATYFGHGGWWYATQVEVLASGLLGIALLLVARGLDGSLPALPAWFGAGLCAGLTIVFKLPLAVAFLVLFAAIWVHLFTVRRERRLAPYAASCAAVLAGVLAVVAPLLAWFAATGLLGELIYATFEYPREVIAEGVPGQNGYLRAFGGLAFAFFALAALLPAVLAHLALDRARKPLLHTLSMAVTLGALVAIGIQIYSLWEYHFQFVFMPVTILFVLALDRFLAARAARGAASAETAVIAVGVLLASVVAGQVASQNWRPAYDFAKHVIVGGQDFASFQAATYPTITELRAIADAAPDLQPGEAIYIFGDPTLHHVTGTRQAVPVAGWYWELAPKSLFERTAADLAVAAPRRIFMVDYYHDLVFERSPAMRALIEDRYEPTADLPQGRWYVLRDAAPES